MNINININNNINDKKQIKNIINKSNINNLTYSSFNLPYYIK